MTSIVKPRGLLREANQISQLLFHDIKEGQIETSSEKIKDALREVKMAKDERLVSLDVKSLYTNIPVEEAIQLAKQIVYEKPEPPPVGKKVFVKLLKLALENVHFVCDGKWFRQVDVLAMGSALSVVLSNIQLHGFENDLKRETPVNPDNRPKDDVFSCGQCRQNVKGSDTAICCDGCGYWFHELCLSTDIKTLMSSEEDFWLCGCSKEASKQAKIFYRYVDDILRTVKITDVKRLLGMANALHRNLEFTIEEEKEGSTPFLDMLIQRRRDNTLRPGWYTKPTDTGLMMDYHSLAPVKYKQNVVEGICPISFILVKSGCQAGIP